MSELGDWYTQQIDVVADGLRRHFSHVVADVEASEVTGFGVISDPTDFTLTPAVNTRQNLAQHMREFVEAGLGDAQEAAAECMWNPGEWAFIGQGSGGSPALVELVSFAKEAQRRTLESGDRQLGVMMFFECIVRALVVLFEEGFFDEFGQAVQVFDVVDLDFTDAPFDRWMAGINTQAAYDSYQKYVALNS